MKKHLVGFIREEAPEFGDGGGADLGLPHVVEDTPTAEDPVTEEPVVEDEPIEEPTIEEPTESPENSEEETTVTEAPIDAQQIGKTIADELRPALQPVTKEAEPQQTMTEAEQAEMINRMKFDEKFVEDMFGTYEEPADKERQLRALDNLRQGVVSEAVTLANYLVEQQTQKLTEQFAPVLQQYTETAQQKAEETFYESYPTLDTDQYRPLAKTVATNIQQSGKEFATTNDYYKEIAAQTETLIKSMVPDFALKGEPTKTKQTQTKAPATQQIGGQGGSGGGKEEPVKKTRQQLAADVLQF
tara:strand:- start:16970 stop:17872 length:903 start_codon:yes stop_codon:yes gene_type:complete